LIILSAFSFSTGNIAIRRGMKTAHDDGIFISIFINMVAFSLLIIIFQLKGLLPPLTLKGFLLFALAGLLTTFTGRSLFYVAIRVIGPSRATSFRCSSPILTVCLAFLFLSERFNISQFIGATAIMGGVWILSREVLGRMDLEVVQASVSSPNESFPASKVSNKSPLFGVLYALGAALSFGIGHFLRKLGLTEVPSPFWGMAIGTMIAWLAVVVHATTKGEIKKLCHNNFNFHHPPWFFILAGLFFTLGQMLSFMAIYFTAVSIVVILASSEPLITLIISRLILRGEEPLNWQVIVSSGAVFLGVILMIF